MYSSSIIVGVRDANLWTEFQSTIPTWSSQWAVFPTQTLTSGAITDALASGHGSFLILGSEFLGCSALMDIIHGIGIPWILVAPQLTNEVIRVAMRYDARDAFQVPLSDEAAVMELTRSIQDNIIMPNRRGVLASDRAGSNGHRRGIIITFISPWWGSDCTQAMINAAVRIKSIYQRYNPNVVLLDGDPANGDVALQLRLEQQCMNEHDSDGVKIKELRRNVLALCCRHPDPKTWTPEMLDTITIHHSLSGLDVIASPMEPMEVDQALAPEVYMQLMNVARKKADVLCVGVPWANWQFALEAAYHSYSVVICAPQRMPTFPFARQVLRLMRATNVPIKGRTYILPTLWNDSEAMTGMSMKEYRQQFSGWPVEFLEPLPDSRDAILALNKGRPMECFDRENDIPPGCHAPLKKIVERILRVSFTAAETKARQIESERPWGYTRIFRKGVQTLSGRTMAGLPWEQGDGEPQR
ncbi:hypothetical protein HZA86_02235 [Candidatus Uhrbacteria bacterium]|nr:hypothetical protein [Candidatus Uhrbacteria bacterium]